MTTAKKTALVTGASRGIGRAIAERLARDGFTVVVNYAGNKASADETVQAIKNNGGNAVAIQADVSSESDVTRLFAEAKALHNQLDVVVHSAGIMPMVKITPAGLAEFDKIINTNLRGAFMVLANAAESLQDGGRIIALSTSVIAKSFPAYGPYIASKAGVEGLVHVLANELRGRNITVNAVAPGPTGTDLFLNGKTEEQIQAIASLAPLGRIGTPEEIASIVATLAGPDGSWVNSQVIRVNGGFA
ncbi:SDR family oxidoreductase [Enterobacter sp. Ap-916]|uniref:SDR family oxidoreductase n=1 Tax=Enterobacteriaceae TaxID=543 RepID=UPI000272A503|nr:MULTISPECIES: SDR family oxidoreductase [unclassified Enterobacter]EJF30343.1 3-oxoacyl-ACP reductase [Enterobacter sp. Ag1]NIF31759.1 SDR family oxidoreductase [Enterobacter sp. Cy-643]NIF47362.1 SDR family oxidoreductase [Enterobacter sp. Ap-1006]NIF57973.1 SDR family oxidoreductase [Enterobacter sp. Ap-867]NIG28085.1 SDR family oxidoreductase [Enterobacter sp. Ap-916]